MAVLGAATHFRPVIQQWAGQYLLDVSLSGSNAKGTAIQGATDADFFISLHPNTQETLKDIYDKLYQFLDQQKRYKLRRQNVSIGATYGATSVDLVPGKRQGLLNSDHSLYRSKKGTWTQTNVQTHINQVKSSGRIAEIRLLKIWRSLRDLEFPSFYLELVVIEALQGRWMHTLPQNVVCVLEYIRDNIETRRFIDPANTNNVISDDLVGSEKQKLAAAARTTLSGNWNQFAW